MTDRSVHSQAPRAGVSHLATLSEDHPLLMAAGSAAGGVLLAMLLPKTKLEARLLGPLGTAVVDTTETVTSTIKGAAEQKIADTLAAPIELLAHAKDAVGPAAT